MILQYHTIHTRSENPIRTRLPQVLLHCIAICIGDQKEAPSPFAFARKGSSFARCPDRAFIFFPSVTSSGDVFAFERIGGADDYGCDGVGLKGKGDGGEQIHCSASLKGAAPRHHLWTTFEPHDLQPVGCVQEPIFPKKIFTVHVRSTVHIWKK